MLYSAPQAKNDQTIGWMLACLLSRLTSRVGVARAPIQSGKRSKSQSNERGSQGNYGTGHQIGLSTRTAGYAEAAWRAGSRSDGSRLGTRSMHRSHRP